MLNMFSRSETAAAAPQAAAKQPIRLMREQAAAAPANANPKPAAARNRRPHPQRRPVHLSPAA